MLILTRNLGETIVIGEDIRVTVVRLNGNQVGASRSASGPSSDSPATWPARRWKSRKWTWTATGAPWGTSTLMGGGSTGPWSATVSRGSIGSTATIRSSYGWSKKPERRIVGCGRILIRSRRGSGGGIIRERPRRRGARVL